MIPKGSKVRLVKSLAPDKLPVGIEGSVVFTQPEMAIVAWDNGMTIPMYNDEVDVIEESNKIIGRG